MARAMQIDCVSKGRLRPPFVCRSIRVRGQSMFGRSVERFSVKNLLEAYSALDLGRSANRVVSP